MKLQQILALKFLGFTLEEVSVCLHYEPSCLADSLARQKAMLEEKREQLTLIIRAVEQTACLVREDSFSWEAFVNLIRVIQMEQNDPWQNHYFTPEQQQTLAEITGKSYTPAAMQRVKQLYPNAWTEADQRKVDEKYAFLKQELDRLVALGTDPASPEAQHVARIADELDFAQGDPEIQASLQTLWEEFAALPPEKRQFDLALYTYTEQERELLEQAKALYQQHKQATDHS